MSEEERIETGDTDNTEEITVQETSSEDTLGTGAEAPENASGNADGKMDEPAQKPETETEITERSSAADDTEDTAENGGRGTTETVRESPFRKLRRKIRLPYYYVPPCPNCGSVKTGRLIKYHSTTNDDYISRASLKNGEIIKFVPDVNADHDLFCSECGFRWSEYIPLRWYTLDEIDAEKKRRGTEPALNEILEEEHEEKKKEKTSLFKMFTRFVGKV